VNVFPRKGQSVGLGEAAAQSISPVAFELWPLVAIGLTPAFHYNMIRGGRSVRVLSTLRPLNAVILGTSSLIVSAKRTRFGFFSTSLRRKVRRCFMLAMAESTFTSTFLKSPVLEETVASLVARVLSKMCTEGTTST